MYTIGPLKEVNMVLFLRNKRFNFMLFWGDYYLRWWRLPIEERACRKTDLGGGDYYLRNSGLPPSPDLRKGNASRCIIERASPMGAPLSLSGGARRGGRRARPPPRTPLLDISLIIKIFPNNFKICLNFRLTTTICVMT